MFSRLLKLILAIFAILVVVVLVRPESREYLRERLLESGTFSRLEKLNVSFESIKSDIKSTVEKLPEPLISKKSEKQGTLTVLQVIVETNVQRKENGLQALETDELLNAAAKIKIEDMFSKQYFEHESPTGDGPAEVAAKANYRFLTVGENLALGIFADEKGLVNAWMDSPGHRANILGKQFSEIGVAVRKGLYKGEEVWMAVQEFGKSISHCPEPNEAEKAYIETSSKKAGELSNTLSDLRDQIRRTSEKDKGYNELVDSYNKLVSEYNNIVKALKARSEAYNKAVRAFNECVKLNT